MMGAQPTLFIGSSTESLDYAYALQSVLDRELETKVWRHGVFLPGANTLTSLIDCAKSSDFAALVLSADDTSIIRGRYLNTPRDNVIFELGLFVGHMGLPRVFLLCPNKGVDLPNDLQGINTLTYRVDRADGDYENAVSVAATGIRHAVRRLGGRGDPAGAAMPSRSIPSADILFALSDLVDAAKEAGATLEIRDDDGRGEVVVVDRTGLRASAMIEMAGEEAVHALDELREELRS
jgi:hypothetical protein